MRVLRRFDTALLATTAEASEDSAIRLVRVLHEAGYVRKVSLRDNHVPGSRASYTLVRDSGPHVPIEREDGSGVWDPNLKTLFIRDAASAKDQTERLWKRKRLTHAERAARMRRGEA